MAMSQTSPKCSSQIVCMANYLKRSLSYGGAVLWNSLPEEVRSLTVFPQFKKAINDYR